MPKQILKVNEYLALGLQKCCDEICTDVPKDGIEFDEEVEFDNGYRMVIQVCGPGNPTEETCWTQGVLFSADGNELGHTDCGESFLGEYCINHDNVDYITDVVIDDEEE